MPSRLAKYPSLVRNTIRSIGGSPVATAPAEELEAPPIVSPELLVDGMPELEPVLVASDAVVASGVAVVATPELLVSCVDVCVDSEPGASPGGGSVKQPAVQETDRSKSTRTFTGAA